MDALFLNHLHFLAAHRGSVRFCRRDIHTEGPFAELNSFVPAGEDSTIPPDSEAVRLAPWSGAIWQERLSSAGFTEGEKLTYMELGNPYAAIPISSAPRVRRVRNENEARAFAAIQAEAFASGNDAVDKPWDDYFLLQALANYREPDQRFYLGYMDDEPVTTTLVVLHAGVCGLYAVATKPAARRAGVAGRVLEHIRQDLLAAGWSRLILQANAGSYAEAYYSRKGFRCNFESQVWRKSN